MVVSTLQTTLEDLVFAEHVDELLAHVGHHVRLLHLGVGRSGRQLEGRVDGLLEPPPG